MLESLLTNGVSQVESEAFRLVEAKLVDAAAICYQPYF